jgi:hypothetical protein
MFAHVVLLQLLQKRDNCIIVGGLRGELDGLFGDPVAVDRAEVFVVRDVEEVDVLLSSSAWMMDVFDEYRHVKIGRRIPGEAPICLLQSPISSHQETAR